MRKRLQLNLFGKQFAIRYIYFFCIFKQKGSILLKEHCTLWSPPVHIEPLYLEPLYQEPLCCTECAVKHCNVLCILPALHCIALHQHALLCPALPCLLHALMHYIALHSTVDALGFKIRIA